MIAIFNELRLFTQKTYASFNYSTAPLLTMPRITMKTRTFQQQQQQQQQKLEIGALIQK